MGSMWSGDRNRFKLPATAHNLKSATQLFKLLHPWYSPYVSPDKYCTSPSSLSFDYLPNHDNPIVGYTYQEHEGSSEEDSDEDVKEMDIESDDGLDTAPTHSREKASKNVEVASQDRSKTVAKGRKDPVPQTKPQEKGKGKAKAKATAKGKGKKEQSAVQEGSKGATGHSRVTRSSQKKKDI